MPLTASAVSRDIRPIAVGVVLAVCLPGISHGQEIKDLLRLSERHAGDVLPAAWRVRAVRGQKAPSSQIVDSAGTRYLRIAGTSRAAWFVHELTMPLAIGGRLSWRWRAPLSPVGASLDAAGTDDAALRVFVVFARRSKLERIPRALFYTLAEGMPPHVAPGPRRPPLASLVVGTPALTTDWQFVSVDPVGDHRRLWHTDAPRIVAIGVMQDTDQTRGAAIGDLMDLQWSTLDPPPSTLSAALRRPERRRAETPPVQLELPSWRTVPEPPGIGADGVGIGHKPCCRK